MEILIPLFDAHYAEIKSLSTMDTSMCTPSNSKTLFPDGSVVFTDNPYSGNRNYAGLLRDSGLETILESSLRGADQCQLYIYGDPEYPDRPYLVCPFKGSRLSDAELVFNARVSSIRVALEWSLSKIDNYFLFVD